MNNQGVRLITLYSALTCIYISLLLIYLVYTDNLFNIGKYQCIPILLFILTMEFLKFNISFMMKKDLFTLKEYKSHKVQKWYGKIKIKEIFKCSTALIAITFIYFLIFIFFGATILSKHEETLMLSMLTTSFTVFPGCLNLGFDLTLSLLVGMKLGSGDLVTEMFQRSIICTLLGTWLGAIVIPLDWDRPWQVWPISCCLGAILGYILAHILTLVKLLPNIMTLFKNKNIS